MKKIDVPRSLRLARWPFRAVALSIFVIGFLGIHGCSDDNPADPGPGETCDHFDADGVVLEAEGETVVSQWEGDVSGEVELELEESRAISVVFLDPDSTRGVPADACEDQYLEVTVDDESIATVNLDAPDGRWSFTITGASEGETSIRVRIIHVDHSDFTSLELPVVVGDEVPIEGFRIMDGATMLVEQVEGVLSGEIELEPDGSLGPLDVVFLDPEGNVVTPEEGATLSFTVADPSIATVTQAGLGDYSFQLDAVDEGETSFTFSLLHMGHSDFDSEPVPVVVGEALSPEAALVREGTNPLTFWNYDPDRGPGRVQGGIVVEVGTTRPGLTVAWLGPFDSGYANDKREEIALSSGYEMSVSVADQGIATATPVSGHPFQIDVQGVSVGTTTVTCELRADGNVVLTTGAFPIEVVPDPAALTVQDHYLNLGGAWTVIVQDGAVV
ncbi:MAG: hypothetical protein KDA27_27200, partial [Candidatus Eisenbacteria bacterium]|nr:hypothetical protein [Candidatus Eisenbacteria bacterium]